LHWNTNPKRQTRHRSTKNKTERPTESSRLSRIFKIDFSQNRTQVSCICLRSWWWWRWWFRNDSQVNVKFSLSTPWSHSENRATAPVILHLCRRLWVVNFTSRPLYPRKECRNLFNRKSRASTGLFQKR
jgi:hypothetical protein